MSQSNVGDRKVYEAGDQRNYKDSEIPGRPDYEQGKENSHLPNDSKDERSIANRLANEERKLNREEPQTEEAKASKQDPTLPAKLHGNAPSKGAQLDAEIRADEEATLKAKGKA
ncbi:hypothetical protein MGN70_013099 [Eutypa lata]|uniref:Uncharacterized protein n=1 Tax=Eutypa lata (strain UCR-EL1) TaxID=1287681 RepID=M7SMI6_EUTLA|nr:hypothetical protein UCREL1_7607 [Eutypa lata UCREL1]KAI1246202.1 hypothetical protein MGN70_013099 [Eutypa lata]